MSFLVSLSHGGLRKIILIQFRMYFGEFVNTKLMEKLVGKKNKLNTGGDRITSNHKAGKIILP